MGRAQQVRPAAFAGIGLLFLALSTGCSTCKNWFDPYKDGEPPQGHVTAVLGWWEKSLYGAHDTLHGGQPIPGYAGRVYLQDSQTQMDVAGTGKLVVYCYDDSVPPEPGKLPTPVESWQFDPQTLKGLLRKDPIGYGYSLFLPTEHPRAKIRFVVVYQEEKAAPIYSMDQAVTIDAIQSMNNYARTYTPNQPVTASANPPQAPAVTQTGAYGPAANPVPQTGGPQAFGQPSAPAAPNALPSNFAPPQNTVQGPPAFGPVFQPAAPSMSNVPTNQSAAVQYVPSQGMPTAVQYGPVTTQSNTRYVIVPGSPGSPTAQVGGR